VLRELSFTFYYKIKYLKEFNEDILEQLRVEGDRG